VSLRVASRGGPVASRRSRWLLRVMRIVDVLVADRPDESASSFGSGLTSTPLFDGELQARDRALLASQASGRDVIALLGVATTRQDVKLAARRGGRFSLPL